MLTGSRLVLVPEFTPDGLCRAVSDHAAAVLFGVPTIYERLLAWGKAGDQLRGLRLATTGSAAMSPAPPTHCSMSSASVVGRTKEIIITGGLNVYPRKVELALEAVPASPRSRSWACRRRAGVSR